MQFILFASTLIAAATASANNHSTSEEPGATWYYNTSFVKVIKTGDLSVRDPIYSTPAVIIIGKDNGELLRCLQEYPNECKVLYKADTAIVSLVITGGYIYAGLALDEVIRCELNEEESCTHFYMCDMRVDDLTVGHGYLYASLRNGTILRCELHQPNICRQSHTFPDFATTLVLHDKYIYAGLNNNPQLMRCSLSVENSCVVVYNMSSAIMALTSMGNSIIAVTSDSRLWHCSHKSDGVYCVSTALDSNTIQKYITQFNGNLYIVDENGNISKCESANHTRCSYYNQYPEASSIALAYETYKLQSRYENEHTTCTWQSDYMCPPYVSYYNEHDRAALEVHVKEGRLYNSKEILVDTSKADEGHSGPAAIFAMGPDGRLLLSSSHKSELLHTSSLFAGSPVAGVGEIVVKNGVIQKMMACSEHYQPDLYLNKQVIQSLRLQGYTDAIDSQLCCTGDECVQSGPDNNQIDNLRQ